MIAEIVFAVFLVLFVRYVMTTYLPRRNMPPGPFPYPFIGNIPHMLCDPINPMRKLAEKYGDIFTLTLPSGITVVLNTASMLRDARLARSGEDIAGRLTESIFPGADLLGNDLVTADYSSVYRFRRRVFKSALHVFGSGKQIASERAGHAVQLVMDCIDAKQGQPFSPRELFESSIAVHLWEWLTSKKVELDDPVVKKLSEFGEITAKQVFLSTFYQLLPFLTYLPTQFNRDIKRAQQIRNEIFPPEFRGHMETYTSGIIRDLTDGFISSYEKELSKESGKNIGAMEDIPGLMLDVVFAGSDSTSSSLAWFLLFVVLHQDVQDKIHQELDVVVGRDRIPLWKDVENLPYLQATLCEAQRSSGLVGLVGTNAICDVTIAGYNIPKGAFVVASMANLHQDEREWPEPKKFKPERFLDVDGKFIGWNTLPGFLPFSVGRRDCAGQTLAKIMLFLFSSILLHRYKIELPEGEEKPTAEAACPAIIMRPKDFKVIAKKRDVMMN